MKQEASTRKKLLLISPMLHQGGFEKVCVETARLMEPFYEVYVLIFTRNDLHYDVKGLRVIDINVPSKEGKLHKALNLWKRMRRVRRVKRHHGIDYTYSFGASANLVNVLTPTGDHIITSLRGSIDLDNEREMRRWCEKSDVLVTVSRDMMEAVRKRFGYKNNTFLYNPLNPAGIRDMAREEITDFPFPAQAATTVISLGRADEQKGYWHLLKAFRVAAKEIMDLRLVFLGDGDFSPYRKLAADLHVEDKVSFLGVRTNPFPYVAKSGLYALTSNHEGFPNALLEAMALGKPVIATDCLSGPREILLSKEDEETLAANPAWKKMYGSYGVLLPDMNHTPDFDATHITGEEQALAYELLAMMKDAERYRTYHLKSAERAEAYSEERYITGLMTILQRLDEKESRSTDP